LGGRITPVSAKRLSTLAAIVCSPVLAATASSAERSAPIPDFSGIWAHMTWPDFEPPAAGPGPITNLSHRDGVSDAFQLVGDYLSPILKPQAADVVRRYGEISLTGVPYPTPSNQCWPGGVPFVFVNIGVQIIQQPDEITFLYSNDHEVRHVRMNGSHPERVIPSWYGDSVAHFEGGTLVIDTIGIKAGPFAMVDIYGTPHSPALHVVERYRLLDYEVARQAEERGQKGLSRLGRDPGFARDAADRGRGLQLEFTVEDANVFTTPWSASISYRRPLGDWPEMVCADSTRDFIGRTIDVPKSAKPDF
jgi:hypothetical protein